MLIVTKVFAGWFPNSKLIGDRVRIRDAPSYEAKTVGLAKDGFEFYLLYIKGKWGKIETHDSYHLIDICFPHVPPGQPRYIGWIYLDYVKYENNLDCFTDTVIQENMTFKKELNDRCIKVLNKLTPANSDSVLFILEGFHNTGYSGLIFLSDLRDYYIEQLVSLLCLDDNAITQKLKKILLAPIYRELVYESIKYCESLRENPTFRSNVKDILQKLERKGYPVDWEYFKETYGL